MGKVLVVSHTGPGYSVPDNSSPIIGMYPYFGTSTQAFAWRAIGSGTIRNLAVYVSANSTTLVTSTFAVRKNGTNQSLKVTYASGATGLQTDTSNSFTVADGDDVDIELAVPNDTSGSRTVTVRTISFEFESDAGTVSRIGTSADTSVSFSTASATRYLTPGGVASLNSVEKLARVLTDYTASDLYASVASNARSTTTTLRSRKNSANGGQSVSYSSGETGVKTDTSGTDSLASGDEFGWSITSGTGTGAITLRAVGSALSSDNNEWDMFHGRNAGLGMTAGLTYFLAPSGGLISPVSTEANGRAYQYFDSHYTNLRANIYTNGATAASTIAFRVSGVDSALSLSYAAGETGVKTDTDIVDVTSGETICYRVVNGTGGSATLSYVGVTGYTDSSGDYSTIVGSTNGEGAATVTQRVTLHAVGGIAIGGGAALTVALDGAVSGTPAPAGHTAATLRHGLSAAGYSPGVDASPVVPERHGISASGSSSPAGDGASTLALDAAVAGGPGAHADAAGPLSVDSAAAGAPSPSAHATSIVVVDGIASGSWQVGADVEAATAHRATLAGTVSPGASVASEIAHALQAAGALLPYGAAAADVAIVAGAIGSALVHGTGSATVRVGAAHAGAAEVGGAAAVEVVISVRAVGSAEPAADGIATIEIVLVAGGEVVGELVAEVDITTGEVVRLGGWCATAYVRPWAATGRPPAWGTTVIVQRAWCATGRRL